MFKLQFFDIRKSNIILAPIKRSLLKIIKKIDFKNSLNLILNYTKIIILLFMSDNVTNVEEIIYKYCKGCDEEKPRSEFHKNGITVHPLCKICRSKERAKENNPRKEGIKFCLGCNKEHPTSDFHSDKRQPDGLQSYCKISKDLQQRKWKSTYEGFMKNLFKDLKHNAKRRHITVNITIEDIKELYQKQNKKCAITNKIMTHEASSEITTQHIKNKWNISVDRIDSKKGYNKNNIQLICAIINRIKINLTINELFLISLMITQNNFNNINKLILNQFNHNFNNNYINYPNNSFLVKIFDEKSDKQK